MKIGIIGGGSIGLLCAAYLAKQHNVTLFTKREEQADLIREKGLFVEWNGQLDRIHIHACPLFPNLSRLEEMDVVFVTVKQYHLMDLLSTIQTIRGCFVFLQNGVLARRYFQTFMGKVYFGIVQHGAQRLADNHVRHNGVGKIILDEAGTNDFQVEQLSTTNFPVETTPSIQTIIRDKLFINAIINPITAIFRVKNGEILKNKELYDLKTQIAYELFQILQIEHQEEKASLLQKVDDIALQTAENKSSMLQDVEQGRKTEIDSILGYLLDQAKELHISAPSVQNFYEQIVKIDSSIK